jgi:glycosyltransferase involved in cell wall biosynthesis
MKIIIQSLMSINESDESKKSLSIIIPCLNEGTSLERMISNINDTIRLDNYEIIIVNSGGTETSAIANYPEVRIFNSPTRLGAPQARNYGANKAYSNNLLFGDAHLEFKEGWGHRIMYDLANNKQSIVAPCITVAGRENIKGYGFRWKNLKMDIEWLPRVKSGIYEIPYAGGACIAVKKMMFDEIGQFDSGIRFWGGADYELSLRTWLLGHRVLCDTSIEVAHVFRHAFPYKVEWRDIYYNKIRIAFSHLHSERLGRFLQSNSSMPDFVGLILKNIRDGILDRRQLLFTNRKNTDGSFFDKFPMDGWN